MKRPRYAKAFQQEAVKQVLDRGYTASGASMRLGVSQQSLYNRVEAYSPNPVDRYEAELKEVYRENLKLKAELRRA